MKRPICLIIRDGWGKGAETDSNAIYKAKTPFTDKIEKEFPTTLINTSGLDVGLPEGYQGNSEVGHLNIGSGRIVYQSLTRIDNAIENGEFFKDQTIRNSIKSAVKRSSAIHLMGLIQEEGVHAVTRHCLEILKIAKDEGAAKVLIHAITDGRDTPPKSALNHLAFLQEGIDRIGTGKIVSVTGRYYIMDRDKRWERTEKGYRAVMQGEGRKSGSWEEAVKNSYTEGVTDEFIDPCVIDYDGISENDTFIFFNFRFDRTRQITKAIVEKEFSEFDTIRHNLNFITMTHYYDNGNFTEVFSELTYKNILGKVISMKGLKQLRISETEKFAHVTFFFNALKNDPFPGEERILINSPRVATYDKKPEMSALEITEKLINEIKSDKYDLIIVNYANCDMVGHTGVFDKIVIAVETVDLCTEKVSKAILEKNGIVILTADHGNAEETKLKDGSPMTSHTTNPVPLTLMGIEDAELRSGGKLSDIAPTILNIIGIEKPAEMDGSSLIIRNPK
ncbi:MAG: 2,3-bisphosphoglycerate-independent phosphoglycerate mutase [Candidatus Aminicenantes bacterium]|nr:2,3-bisphosphoglycerate-independent phosphoglycerate mutase [Candidatus Aminicenantes bacterium]